VQPHLDVLSILQEAIRTGPLGRLDVRGLDAKLLSGRRRPAGDEWERGRRAAALAAAEPASETTA